MLNRRSLLLVSAVSMGLAATGCSGKSLPSSFSVSTAKLQSMLAQRFPKQYPVAGLLQIQLQTPHLTMLAERNAVNALHDAQLSGPAIKGSLTGQLNVDFALRYEPTDRTLRAHQIKLNSLQMDGLAPAMTEMLTTYAAALADQALGQVVLYQLQDKDLALVDAMNMEPGVITVTPDGLTVTMVQKNANTPAQR